jgi:SAM-dependent MidA family methyltransferase
MLPSVDWRPWRRAQAEALYGPGGFYVRDRPRAHFSTSVSASPLFAVAVRRLAERVDEALGRPDPFDVVDVGTGDGALLAELGPVPVRWRLTGLDLNGDWPNELPRVQGLLFANEWLDNVPLDVLIGDRLVEVSQDGSERLGAPAARDLLTWRDDWWPGAERVEVGLTRDRAWASAVAQVERGLAVAVDYGHLVDSRRTTLTGYRAGRQVPPTPDGSCDLTAHVALDSCAATTGARLLTQREALSSLGISAARRARSADSAAYLSGLQAAGQARALLDPLGLGGFGWLVQPVGIPDPLGDWPA